MSLKINDHTTSNLLFGRMETVGETQVYVASHADFDYRQHTFSQLLDFYLYQKNEIEELDEDVRVFFAESGATPFDKNGAEIFLRSRVLLVNEFMADLPEER